MSQQNQKNWFRLLAVSTVCVALVTVIFGALTTSKNAGMAFRDWPTSDGYLMVTYPWLQDFAKDWDKFLEHGHRLAGMLIGMWSIALVAAAFVTDQRSVLKLLSLIVLVGVICQGLLGGFRVQLDERGLAMMHGAFAAVVLSVMGSVVVLSGNTWKSPEPESERSTLLTLKILSVLVVLVLVTQYLLGGMIRHKGTGLHEHLGLGLAALGLIFVNFTYSGFSNVSWLRKSGFMMLMVAFGQVLLGIAAWVMKYGFSPTGFVAINDSIQQVGFRTAHTVWGIITFQVAIIHLLKVYRVGSVSEFVKAEPISIRKKSQTLAVEGGQE